MSPPQHIVAPERDEVSYRTFQAMFDNNLHLSHLKIKLDVRAAPSEAMGLRRWDTSIVLPLNDFGTFRDPKCEEARCDLGAPERRRCPGYTDRRA